MNWKLVIILSFTLSNLVLCRSQSNNTFSSIPTEILKYSMIPMIDNLGLSRLLLTHSNIRNNFKCVLGIRAINELHHELLSIINKIEKNDHYIKKLDIGLYDYLTRKPKPKLLHFLRLFIIDSSMNINVILRILFDYEFDKRLLLLLLNITDFNKFDNLRHSINANYIHDDNFNLITNKFKYIMNKSKYKQLFIEWNEIQIILKSDNVETCSLWNDMLFIIKKDILRILMNDTNVNFFYNDQWLLFHEDMEIYYNTNQWNENEVIIFELKLAKFEQTVYNLFHQIKIENNYNYTGGDKINESNFNLLKNALSPTVQGLLNIINNSMAKIDNDINIGIMNEEFYLLITTFMEIRTFVLINHPFQKNKESQKILNELELLKQIIISRLYNTHNKYFFHQIYNTNAIIYN